MLNFNYSGDNFHNDRSQTIRKLESYITLLEMRQHYFKFTQPNLSSSTHLNNILKDLNIDNFNQKFLLFERNGRSVYEENNQSKVIAFAQAFGLLPPCDVPDESKICYKCEELGLVYKLKILPSSSAKIGFAFKCSNPDFRHKQSALFRTIFSHCNLSVFQVLKITLFTILPIPRELRAVCCKVAENTMTDYLKKLFKVMTIANQHRFEKLGGEGEVVEVDESQFKSKYNRGRLTKFQSRDIWVMGLTTRKPPKKIFATRIYKRNIFNVDTVIEAVVKEGSVLVSDQANVYKKVAERLTNLRLSHRNVNHKENYVDKFDRTIHTQNVESRWRWFKQNLHSCQSNDLIDGYIEAYIYKTNNFDHDLQNTGKNFSKLLEDIASVFAPYPQDQLTFQPIIPDTVKSGTVKQVEEDCRRREQKKQERETENRQLKHKLSEIAAEIYVPPEEDPQVFAAKSILERRVDVHLSETPKMTQPRLNKLVKRIVAKYKKCKPSFKLTKEEKNLLPPFKVYREKDYEPALSPRRTKYKIPTRTQGGRFVDTHITSLFDDVHGILCDNECKNRIPILRHFFFSIPVQWAKLGDANLTRDSLCSLIHLETCVDDEFVNYFMEYQKFLNRKRKNKIAVINPLFWLHLSNPRAKVATSLLKDIFSAQFVLFPVCLNDHWYLGWIDHKRKLIEVYDSIGIDTTAIGDEMRYKLFRLQTMLEQQDNDFYIEHCIARMAQLYRVYPPHRIPRQGRNINACGVMICLYAEILCEGKKLKDNSFTTEVSNNIDVLSPIECERIRLAHDVIKFTISNNLMLTTGVPQVNPVFVDSTTNNEDTRYVHNDQSNLIITLDDDLLLDSYRLYNEHSYSHCNIKKSIHKGDHNYCQLE